MKKAIDTFCRATGDSRQGVSAETTHNNDGMSTTRTGNRRVY